MAPDIRYLARLRREQTHLGLDRLKELMGGYPDLRAFLSGYQVHLLIDEVDIAQLVSAAFPLNLLPMLLRKQISRSQMTMLVEINYLQSGAEGKKLAGEHNAVLEGLGITVEQTRQFQQALQAYFDARTFEAALNAFQKIGMVDNSRLEKYLSAYQTMQGRPALRRLFMLGVRNARLDARVSEHVRRNMTNA